MMLLHRNMQHGIDKHNLPSKWEMTFNANLILEYLDIVSEETIGSRTKETVLRQIKLQERKAMHYYRFLTYES